MYIEEEEKIFKHFHCMSRLCVTLCVSDLKCLPTFLISCPNLKSLILALDDYKEMRSEEMNQMSFSSVPECLLSSLEFVNFESPISGYASEMMKLVKYFIENTTILKRLTLHVNHGSTGSDISKELLKIPRRSSMCQVVGNNRKLIR
ncbi:unnamed protein product [Thlaspi arvense]|uniref:FBD domain-containing protein n=1 Tax=Thlaspi arvense TaxID=13288 RepID=A0AAU9SSL1_THLAR|nr:unnamed protein product [Thlaspi arvense]